MDLGNYMIFDTVTGTVLCASHCVLVRDDSLTESEWNDLNDGMSDSQVCDLGKRVGQPLSELLP